jgi:hypothetical protein
MIREHKYLGGVRMKKYLSLAIGLLIATAVLSLFKPVRTWASQEGSYLYHQFFIDGPVVIYAATSYTGSDNTARQGLMVNGGTKASPTTLSMQLLGAVTTANRPSSPVEGQLYWNSTTHAVGFYDGTHFWESKTTSWSQY